MIMLDGNQGETYNMVHNNQTRQRADGAMHVEIVSANTLFSRPTGPQRYMADFYTTPGFNMQTQLNQMPGPCLTGRVIATESRGASGP